MKIITENKNRYIILAKGRQYVVRKGCKEAFKNYLKTVKQKKEGGWCYQTNLFLV